MTSEQFDKEIARLKRRAQLLQLARDGNADVKKVKVVEHWVRRHKVRSHTRVIYSKRGDK